MRPWLKAYAAALLVLALLDALWLGLLARGYYESEMGALMAEQVRALPGLLFYLAYPAGLVALALQTELKPTLWRSGLVGAMAYGTYDLTNLATLEGWSAALSVLDMAWGVTISASAGAAAWWVARRRR